MGKTVWEMLSGRMKGPVELQITNPLKLKLGTAVQIKDIDLKDLTFYTKRILEYKRTIGGETFIFTDYDLLARPLGGDDVKVRLRLNPRANPDEVAGLTHNVVLLKLYDEVGYNEDLHRVVTDTTKMFEVLENGLCSERYWRINDVQDSYKPEVLVATEGSKAIDVSDLDRLHLEYWDYWREIKDEAAQTFVQYLFVEMDTDNGWFQLWRGSEIDPLQVTVL